MYLSWLVSQLMIRASINYEKIIKNLEKLNKWIPHVGSHFTLLKAGKMTKMPLLGRVGPTALEAVLVLGMYHPSRAPGRLNVGLGPWLWIWCKGV